MMCVPVYYSSPLALLSSIFLLSFISISFHAPNINIMANAMVSLSAALLPLLLCTCYNASPGASFSPQTHPLSHRASASLQTTSSSTTLHLSERPPRKSRRSSSDRPRRPPPNRSSTSSRSRTTQTADVGERKRAPHQFDHTKVRYDVIIHHYYNYTFFMSIYR